MQVEINETELSAIEDLCTAELTDQEKEANLKVLFDFWQKCVNKDGNSN